MYITYGMYGKDTLYYIVGNRYLIKRDKTRWALLNKNRFYDCGKNPYVFNGFPIM